MVGGGIVRRRGAGFKAAGAHSCPDSVNYVNYLAKYATGSDFSQQRYVNYLACVGCRFAARRLPYAGAACKICPANRINARFDGRKFSRPPLDWREPVMPGEIQIIAQTQTPADLFSAPRCTTWQPASTPSASSVEDYECPGDF